MESVKLHMLMQDIGRILQVLSKQPYDQVADIIEKIKVQVQHQMTEDRAARQGTATPQVNGTDHPEAN
jgi:hypothetical protein